MKNDGDLSENESWRVRLSAADLMAVAGLVEFRRMLLRAPPDEDSDEMRELREMTPESLDAEALDLQDWDYDSHALFLTHGQADSGSTQFRRQYRLKLVRAVMGDERFERAVAPIHAKWGPILEDIHRSRKEPRACIECGSPTVFEWLCDELCEECRV